MLAPRNITRRDILRQFPWGRSRWTVNPGMTIQKLVPGCAWCVGVLRASDRVSVWDMVHKASAVKTKAWFRIGKQMHPHCIILYPHCHHPHHPHHHHPHHCILILIILIIIITTCLACWVEMNIRFKRIIWMKLFTYIYIWIMYIWIYYGYMESNPDNHGKPPFNLINHFHSIIRMRSHLVTFSQLVATFTGAPQMCWWKTFKQIIEHVHSNLQIWWQELLKIFKKKHI
jgi:hypothetical protein